MRMNTNVETSRKGKGRRGREPRPYSGGATRSKRNENSELRPSYGQQQGTELDLDAISECLRTDHKITERMTIASENGEFDVAKMG
jgi:hypothetical protein